VKNYLAALNDVYLFFFTDMFDYSVKRQIYNPSKLYAVDTAMINSVSFRFSRNIGHLHENIVFLELKRRTREIYYGKTRKGKEVDFLIKEGLHVVEAIQVSSSLSDAKTRKRELEALTEIREELKKGGQEAATRDLTMTVITDDEENIVETENGHIRIIPLWKWLLG
jgi:predicted AAA+ superfamily ATPase